MKIEDVEPAAFRERVGAWSALGGPAFALALAGLRAVAAFGRRLGPW